MFLKRCSRLFALTFILVCVSCSAQRSPHQESSVETLSERGEREASAPIPKKEHEGRGLGPQGPSILIGSPGRQLKLPAAPPDAQDNEALLVAVDTPYQIFEGQGSYVHVAAWHTDGSPATKARVFAGEEQVGETDAHGSLVFLYPPKGSDPDRDALGHTVLTVLDSQETSRRGVVSFTPQMRTPSFASDHLFVYTDRGVYAPGDEVEIRAIGWHLEQDYAPLVGEEIEFMLKDASGEVVGAASRTTDAFGVTSMTLPLPHTAPQGLYRLEVAHGQVRQHARLQVRPFTPPRVIVTHDLGRFLTPNTEALSISVGLEATSGEEERGTLSLGVRSQKGEVLLEAKKKVEGAGPHIFSLSKAQLQRITSPAHHDTSLSFVFTFEEGGGAPADEVVRDVRLNSTPYVAVLEADKDQYSAGDPVEIVAKVRDLDGVPLRDTMLRLDVVDQKLEAKTSAQGVARFSFSMPDATLSARLFAGDAKESIAQTTLRVVPPRPMVSHIARPIIAERERARVTVRFPTGILPVEDVVHMDVTDTSGAIVNAVLLPIRETRDGYVAEGEFEAPTWGSMLLTFFTLGKSPSSPSDPSHPHYSIGLMTEGQNLVVYPNRELDIVLDGVPDEARPGAPLSITARVEDAQGRAVDASIGAALVDGRILSLKDPLEITPMDRFYEPTIRTMSTVGSKILTWPVVSRNWGAKIHDVALPPFPFLPGGEAIHEPRGGAGQMPMHAMGALAQEEDTAEFESAPVPAPKSMALSSDKKKVAREESEEEERSEPATTITIRTRFEETSLWLPHLRADAEVTIEGTLPDTITDQELLIVASDQHGGVGVARKTIRVDQALWTCLHLPALLEVGALITVPITVTNSTKEEGEFTLSLRGEEEGLEARLETRSVLLGPGRSTTVMAQMRALRPSRALGYTLSVEGGGAKDVVKATIGSAPSGVVEPIVLDGFASSDAPFERSWTIAKGSRGDDAWARVTLPSVTSAMVGLDEVEHIVRDAPLAITTDLVTASLILQYARRRDITSSALRDLEWRVMRAITALQMAQAKDGSLSYWRNGRPSAYVTAWALEGMLEAQELDVPIPPSMITKAATWLASQVDEKGRVPVDATSFWEGESEEVRRGVSAEVFDVLASVPESLRTSKITEAVTRQAKIFLEELERGDLDALTAGRALHGLRLMSMITPKEARPFITILLSSRDEKHWEPSWFHAYAGRIEATTAMLEAMAALGGQKMWGPQMRDALMWVLSTRDAWGMWHNERGTAAAVRALMAAGIPSDVKGGEVRVLVDGKVVATATVDPKDPLMSAASLRHIYLGSNFGEGTHDVSVHYAGETVPVEVVARRWSAPKAKRLDEGGVRLVAQGAREVERGEATALSLTLSSHAGKERIALLIAPSSIIAPDLGALAQQAREDEALDMITKTSQGLLLTLAPGTHKIDLSIPFDVLHLGEGEWPAVTLLRKGEVIGGVSAGAIVSKK